MARAREQAYVGQRGKTPPCEYRIIARGAAAAAKQRGI